MNEALLNFTQEFSSLIRARYALIYLHTPEEGRAIRKLREICQERKSTLYDWSRTKGVLCGETAVSDAKDPMQVLKWYETLNDKSVLVLKDFHPYMKDPAIVRKLRDISQDFKKATKNVVLLSPVLTVPPDLSKDLTVLELPLPTREEIETLVGQASKAVPSASTADSELTPLTDAACGLTYDEIENVLAKSLVSKGRLDKKLVQDEKKQIVKRSGLLEFIEVAKQKTEVGGLSNLKSWLSVRRRGFSEEAKAINLPSPKGILLVGIPGCGKSLTAMTVGASWELPLLRLDMGKIFSGLVGSSEGNIRSAISTCEAVAPCVLWIDEIEKGLSGTQSSGQSDGGTTSRVFGTILTWMQEKKSPVFVIATANDISSLPPEFLRKGRFDEIFFVDLPHRQERMEILDIHMKRFGWQVKDLDKERLMELTEGFSGSELENILVDAQYLAFGAHETIEKRHVEEAARSTVPLSKTMADKIDFLRNWAEHRARPASKKLIETKQGRFDSHYGTLEIAPQEEKSC